LVETLSAADVHLVSQDRRTVGLIVPSKLAGILAAGRPALFVGPAEAEVAETLAKHGCGARVAEGETGRFVELLRDWAGDSEARARMGRAARSAFEAEYSRELAVGRIRTALESGGK
jgi:glycosyltransferase involved in cell wall biosynthesis